MTEQLCKVVFDEKNNKVIFESAETKGLTLSQTILDDKRYGKMIPSNGKYFTYRVLNEDVEFSRKEARKAMQFAQRRWRIYAKLPPFRPAKPNEKADFRLEFRTVESDPDQQLQKNTIMYHYYPINDTLNRLRGLCVVNKRFYYTTHGNKIKGEEMIGVQVQFPDGKYRTMDFDAIYAHELGHGLGLPHDTEPNNVMSNNYGIMAEYPQMRDQSRIQQKYGARFMPGRLLARWLKWLKYASDRN